MLTDDSELSGINPYEIRVKGLRQELSKEELSVALLHLIKHRGVHNVNEVKEDTGNELSTKEQISRNSKALEEKYVAELQLERLKLEGKVRGTVNRFKTSDYVKEAKQLLKVQKHIINLINHLWILIPIYWKQEESIMRDQVKVAHLAGKMSKNGTKC